MNSKTHLLIKTILVATIWFSSSFLFAQQRVVGYMPSWAGSASSIQYDKLTHINYAFALPNTNGTLKPIDNPAKLQQIVSSAHANGVKVLIAIGGWSDQGVVLDSRFEAIGANPTYRQNLINGAMALVNTYNLDGVDIDWEYPDAGASASNYQALMQGLANQLHPQGKLLTAAVIGQGGQGGGVNTAVFGIVDWLNIMAYDGNNFDHSTMSYAQGCMNYWKGRGLPANKAVLGVPFYGRPSWESFATLIGRGADPYADVYAGVGYNGITTIRNKTQYAIDNGGGIMIWELSQDATGQYSLLTAIDDVMGNVNPPPPPTPHNIPGLVQAEAFSGQSGIQTEATTDNGGGSNIGYIDNGDWSEYNVNVTNGGSYSVDFRVATANAGGTIQIRSNGNLVGSVFVDGALSNGWQDWFTASTNINLNAGTQTLRLSYVGSGTGLFNINWIEFSAGTPPPPNNPPTVNITSPSNGASFTSGNNISISANAVDSDGNVTKVDFYRSGTLIGTDNSSPYSITWNNAGAGNYSLTAVATDDDGATTTSSAVGITVNNPTPTQAPYNGTPFAIPGTIQAEHYDLGGEGVAYHDVTTENSGGALRNDAVDIEAATEGGHNIGWIATGEWVEYTVNVASSGQYKLDARVASTSAGNNFRVEMNGQNISGTLTVPNTGGWQNWQTVTVNNISLSAGQKIMRIYMQTGNFNVNYITFTTQGTPPPPNNAPSVSISSPSNGTTFTEGSNITITANASDTDGSVSSVQFFNGSTSLGTDNSAPYSVTINNATAGNYSITARATDDDGAQTTSSAVSITVETDNSNNCSGLSQYVASGGYGAGDRVYREGNVYECKPWPYSGWCNGAAWAYAPGSGAYWADAWVHVGSCGNVRMSKNTLTGTGDAEDVLVVPNPVLSEDAQIYFGGDQAVQLTIVNAYGDVQLQIDNYRSGDVIDVSELKGGMHIAILDGAVTVKFFKE